MLRIFKVKRAVKNINPLEDSSSTYYEEVNMGGLMPNERALKVCYQNGDIWKLKDFTTKTEQVEIQKILNSTLYEFNGFFIIKNKNDAASREYYCFITVDKANEVLEDKHWLIWLTVYYDLNGSTGFKILLRWDLVGFIFTIVKNPIQINLLEEDDFNAEQNHYSLPTVAVIRKWYYHKEWLEINTPINNSQSMIYSIPKKCPMENIEIEMPKENVIRQLIRNRINKTDKEYDLLSMDFGRQAGHNGYNSVIISAGHSINSYDAMKQDRGYSWLSFRGDVDNTVANNPTAMFCKILDTEGKVIKHPLYNDFVVDTYKNIMYNMSNATTNIYGIQCAKGVTYEKEYWLRFTIDGDLLYPIVEDGWMILIYFDVYKSDLEGKTKSLANIQCDYPPFINYVPSLFQNVNGSYKAYKTFVINYLKNSYRLNFWDFVNRQSYTKGANQIPNGVDKPTDEAYFMPIWGKLLFTLYDADDTVEKANNIISELKQLKKFDYYYGHNSHLQLKYLVGYWKARS